MDTLLQNSELFTYVLSFIPPQIRTFALTTSTLWNCAIRRQKDFKRADTDRQACTAAQYGYVEYLKHSCEHGYVCDYETLKSAARGGSLVCLQYILENCTEMQLSNNQLSELVYVLSKVGAAECLKYLHNKTMFQWTQITAFGRYAVMQNLECLKFAHESGCDWCEAMMATAAEHGKLECIKYAHKNGCTWNEHALGYAASGGHLECLKYLYENSCERTRDNIAISEAAHGGMECFKYVLEHQEPFFSHYTYNSAARGGHLDILKLLLDSGCYVDKFACEAAAEGGNLECLKFVHENGAQWLVDTEEWLETENAAANGHLDCLKYLHEHGCAWGTPVCSVAAEHGHLHCLKYLHENGCEWDKFTLTAAVREGNIECLKYALDNGCGEGKRGDICTQAAELGNLECLILLHERGCPWDRNTTMEAAVKGHLRCLVYAHEHGCEWDEKLFLRTLNKVPGDNTRRLKCIKYALENGCPFPPALNNHKEIRKLRKELTIGFPLNV